MRITAMGLRHLVGLGVGLGVGVGVAALVASACAAPRPEPSATPTPTPTPSAGVISTVTIPATASGFRARDAQLYLPPAYGQPSAEPLPVLVLLAGVPGHVGDWFDHGGAQHELDAFAARHGGRAPVVVAPDDTGVDDQDLLCMDSSRGNVDTYLSRDVPAWITTHLHVDTDTSRWAVGGLSYGGTCAYELAVRHPALFPTFLDFSGEKQPMIDTLRNAIDTVFDGDSAAYLRQDPLTILGSRKFPASAGVLAVGDDDEPYTSEERVVLAACKRAGMKIQWLELPGGHDWDVWSTAFQRSLPWLVRRMRVEAVPR